jgi:hypothetical protein
MADRALVAVEKCDSTFFRPLSNVSDFALLELESK